MTLMNSEIYEKMVSELGMLAGKHMMSVLSSLLLLFVGWVIAVTISSVVRKLLNKTTIDNKIAALIGGRKKMHNVEDNISKIVFYLIMLFVIVGFLQSLGLSMIADPINTFLDQIMRYAPRLIGAGALFILAWFVATILREIVVRAFDSTHIDEKISKQKVTKGDDVPISKTLGEVAYWIVYLLFLPAILDALAMNGLLNPIQAMINKLMTYIPNLFSAGVILMIGWFIARIVQNIATNLLKATGVDGLMIQVGVDKALGSRKISDLLGMVAYIFVLIPVILGALDALSLKALTDPISNMLNEILLIIPNMFAAVALMFISYIVGKVVAGWITIVLTGVGFNNILVQLGVAKKLEKGSKTPSEMVGYLTLSAIILFSAIEACNIIGFISMSELIREFILFGSQIVMGLVILAIGIYFANIVVEVVKASGTRQSNMLANVARCSILLLSGAMALNRMGLANEIVNLAFTLLLGAVSLAAALAFGLGGRDVAAKLMQEWVEKNK